MTLADIFGDLARATALLTRLPLRARFDPGSKPTWVWAFPLVGAVIGAVATLIALGIAWLGLPIAAAAALLAHVLVTGALHEDGLADTADGFWGGWTRERRLEIMKDSHIGTYGVLALVLVFLIRWDLWASVLLTAPLALLAGGALSRAVLPAMMYGLPHARESGLSHATGRPPLAPVLTAAAIGAFVALGCLGWTVGGLVIVTAATVALGMAALARAKIGGQTGDILGATQVLTEIACLATMVAAFQ